MSFNNRNIRYRKGEKSQEQRMSFGLMLDAIIISALMPELISATN